ncbi:S-layer homology domain-containing protein [Candidatus Peribacteria bacterium]|nr:S-layer homology domain-containing protein [Candidatus Peribacteria bacterium]
MKRIISILMLCILPVALHAEGESYSDVGTSNWFYDSVESFVEQEYLDASKDKFRPADLALRSEFIKLVVEINGGIIDELPDMPGFSDVSPGDWFFGYMEEAGREEWLKGDGDCYSVSRFDSAHRDTDIKCFVRPHSNISRAEAAVIVRRAFGKSRLGKAPAFSDNPAGSWFSDAIQAAADHCILKGDDGTRKVRPGDPVNRAEMVTMLYRVDSGGRYPEC